MGGGSLTTTVYPIPSNKMYSITNEITKNEINNVTYSYVTIDNDFSITEREDNAYNLCYYDIVLFDRRTQQFKLFDPKNIDDFRRYLCFVEIFIQLDDISNNDVSCIINNKRYVFVHDHDFGDYQSLNYRLHGFDIELQLITEQDIICDQSIKCFEKRLSYSASNNEEYINDYDLLTKNCESLGQDLIYVKLSKDYKSKYLYFNEKNPLIYELTGNNDIKYLILHLTITHVMILILILIVHI